MANPIQIAVHKPTNKFIHVDTIKPTDKDLRCQCYCLECDEKLEAVLEFKDPTRIPFFRHSKNLSCEGAPETALHELGKQILVENNRINIKNHGNIFYSNPVAEKRFEKIRPDVTAIFEGKPIHFEIYVTHAVDAGKAKFLAENKIKSVEINLSNCQTTSFEEIKRMVLEQTELQTVFYWQEKEAVETLIAKQVENNWFEQVLKAAFFLLMILGIIRLFRNIGRS
ncbi:MAG: hypothetical protein IPK08_19635 [Bacteroidetes bacterium]|nr:hypothetical protein [Bacteroidota bacterium]